MIYNRWIQQVHYNNSYAIRCIDDFNRNMIRSPNLRTQFSVLEISRLPQNDKNMIFKLRPITDLTG